MHAILLAIHVLVAVLLIAVILIQRGRGGGLVESFSGVESMFGTKTSQFLTRTTAVLATIFLFTSISLALIAARQSRSLIDEKAISFPQEAVSEEEVEVVEEEQPEESELPLMEEGQEQEQEQTVQEDNREENISE